MTTSSLKTNPLKNRKKIKQLQRLLEYPEVKSWRALMGAFTTILSKLEKGLLAEGCSVSRFQILFFLYFEGDLAAISIARKLVVTRGNITMFLRRMEADGLIKAVIPPGQKRPLFTLTAKGIKLFEKIFPPHIGRVRTTAPVLSEDSVLILQACSARRD